GKVHAGLAAVFAAGPWPDLAVDTVRDCVATVMIASSQHERWGRHARKLRKEVGFGDVAGETVCVIEADLHTVLAGLPEPTPGGGRILVENYASVLAFVRTGLAIGFIPQLDIGDDLNHAAYQGLEIYRIKEQVPTR